MTAGTSTHAPRAAPRLLIALAFVAFVSLGLPDGLLGVGWASIRSTFGRPLSDLGLLLGAGTSGYLLASFLGGQLVRALGVGRLLVISCLLATAALAGYSLAPVWGLLIPLAFVGGLGGGAIDAGINTVAAARFSPRVMNWLHAFWGVGASTGPLLLTAVLASQHSWRVGYGMMAGVLAVLSILFLTTLGQWRIDARQPAGGHPPMASIGQALARPMVWVQILLFFLYCGIEMSAGQLYYTLFAESRGIAPAAAGVAVGAYWAALTVGRLVFGQLAHTHSPRTVLRAGMLIAIAGAALLAWNPLPWVGLAGGVAVGFGLAPIFPTLMSITPHRVGEFYAPQSVGFQVAAASAGIVAFPSLVTLLARHWGLNVVLCAYLLAAGVVLMVAEELAHRAARRPGPPEGKGQP